MALSISNANPIQFWPIGDETFNEKEVCSIYPSCFCQPFEQGDEIYTQISDYSGITDYTLAVYDENGNQVSNDSFVEISPSIYQVVKIFCFGSWILATTFWADLGCWNDSLFWLD